jgi:hypothetical protein
MGICGCDSLRSIEDDGGDGMVGGLQVESCRAFTSLPDGFRASGSITVRDCPSFTTLPKGLPARHDLMIRKCPAWDGHIPDDAYADKVFTDRHPKGISLEGWRTRHPDGEFPEAGQREPGAPGRWPGSGTKHGDEAISRQGPPVAG